jgi:hypothetical protein
VFEYLGDNALAVAALLASLTTGSVQVATFLRGRRRIRVRLTGGGEWSAAFGNRSFVDVFITNAGGPAGIEDIKFVWLSDGGPPPEGYGWHSFSSPWFAPRDGDPGPSSTDVLGVRRTPADGESWTWRGEITTSSYEAASRPQRFRADVRLTSGKTKRSNELHFVPRYYGPGDPPPNFYERALPAVEG